MRWVVAIGLLLSVSAELTQPREYYESLFAEHLATYNIQLRDGAEFVKRLDIFASNVARIEAHNADPTQTYQLGINQFTHLSFGEFTEAVRLKTLKTSFSKNLLARPAPVHVGDLPASVDWEASGAVTPVKDQGQCGSCWAFSSAGAMEGAYYIKYGSLFSFAEQHFVSCAPEPNAGCNGGWMPDAFSWAQTNNGVAATADYPYTSGTTLDSGSCDASVPLVANSAPQGYIEVQAKNVTALMAAVAQQPVSIAVQANQMAFQSYKSGVLTGSCGTNVDHGMLLVGYGTSNGVDYWKIKNSWGSTWGMDGYILIERSSADKCGVLDTPFYPVY